MNRKLLMSFVLVLLFVFQVSAQDRMISEKVTSSEDGSALSGVFAALYTNNLSTTYVINVI